MATSPHQAHMTVEEYFQLRQNNPDAHYEYNDGQVTLLAGGSLNHARIASNINTMLHTAFRDRACQSFTSDAMVRLPLNHYVLPDVTVTCDERDHADNQYIQYPCVIFEILSPSTEAHDRGRKFTFYQKCPSIQEYLLVSTYEPYIEIFRREKDPLWMYRAFQAGEQVALASLGLRFPTEDIYQNVVF